MQDVYKRQQFGLCECRRAFSLEEGIAGIPQKAGIAARFEAFLKDNEKEMCIRDSPGIQGGPLEHVIAAKAVAFGEILQPEFKEYAKQVQKNAAVLAQEMCIRDRPVNHLLRGIQHFHTDRGFRLDTVIPQYVPV